tara:strand:+ start:4067 stop:4483 length:417 start_codon:yes stop_codon:yes gene_type:complete
MIGGIEMEVGDEDVSCLNTDGLQEVELQDIATMSETEVEMLLDDTLNIIMDGTDLADPTPALGELKLKHKELITITGATRNGDDTPAEFAAWGGIKKISLPEYVNNTTRRLKFTIKWLNRDLTGTQVKPTYTPAVPTV